MSNGLVSIPGGGGLWVGIVSNRPCYYCHGSGCLGRDCVKQNRTSYIVFPVEVVLGSGLCQTELFSIPGGGGVWVGIVSTELVIIPIGVDVWVGIVSTELVYSIPGGGGPWVWIVSNRTF